MKGGDVTYRDEEEEGILNTSQEVTYEKKAAIIVINHGACSEFVCCGFCEIRVSGRENCRVEAECLYSGRTRDYASGY
jgi:hypothetical protein